MNSKPNLLETGEPFPSRTTPYDSFIMALPLRGLYSPKMVVNLARKQGLLEPEQPARTVAEAERALSDFCAYRLPSRPDRWLKKGGQPVDKAWYGWRWKAALPRGFFTDEEWRAVTRALRRDARALWFDDCLERVIRFRTLGVLVLIVLGFLGVRHYRPAIGWEVIRQDGPAAFFHWLADPRTAQEKLDRAWSLFSQGALEEAASHNAPLLKEKQNSRIKGDAHYLAGLLADEAQPGKAMDHFTRAMDIYGELEAFNSLQNMTLVIAHHFLRQGDPNRAWRHLEKARLVPAGKPNLGYFHEMQSGYYFAVGMYANALCSAQDSLEHYRGQDPRATARMLTAKGFYHILTGDFRAGVRTSLEAEVAILHLTDTSMYHMNLVNLYLVAKCENQRSEPYLNLLLERVSEHREETLRRKVEFAWAFPCPEPPLCADGADHSLVQPRN